MSIYYNGLDATITSNSSARKGTVKIGVSADRGLIVDETTGDVSAGKAYLDPTSTTGYFRIPVVLSPPVVAPSEVNGYIPMAYCVADSGLYLYDGSGWKSSSLVNTVSQEILTGLDGVTAEFELQHVPIDSSAVKLYRNGMRLANGLDFTVSDSTVTTGFVPFSDEVILAEYQWV